LSLLINRSKKWGFIHIPKTGGTSITSVLHKVKGTEYVTKAHNHIGKFENIKDYHIMCFVRNPYTRFASAYYHQTRINGWMSINKFIENMDLNDYVFFPQYWFIQNGSTEDKKVTFIGRYENFINDFNLVMDYVGKDGHSIPHHNRNSIYDKHPNLNQHDFYKHIYNDKDVKNWVEERYSNDFKIFNYELDI
tara:strand:- start:1494 stop:2069 length:576 start_codon:yes stop_codon:yes gene_type:complete